MKHLIFVAGLVFAISAPLHAKEETKDVKVGNKTVEARVPKSASIDCKDKANADKLECKKESKAMPKIDKPKEAPPADAKKK